MKTALTLVAALALSACVGAPITQTTQAFCASLPAARAAEDFALSLAKNPPTAEDLAALKAARAQMDARCAQAAAAAASTPK